MLLFFLILAFCQHSRGDFDGETFRGSLEDVINEAPCVRLFSNSGDMGCRTVDSSGTLGALYHVNSHSDVLGIRNLPVDFVALISGSYFNSSVLGELSKDGKLQGVIVIDDQNSWISASHGKYSVDVASPQGSGTPQEKFVIDETYEWNPFGNGLMYESFR